MLAIRFEGFFQCRLATDTDDWHERRGRDGWTFAFGSEPDLDRVIRFNDPIALRTHAPPVEVRVKEVAVDVNPIPNHPLLGARMDLINDPVFEGREGNIADPGDEPISPMVVRMSKGKFSVERGSAYDVMDPKSRKPYLGQGISAIPDPNVRGVRLANHQEAVAYRASRKKVLETDRLGQITPDQKVILDNRIDKLRTQNGGAVTASVFSAVNYAHPLKDGARLQDPDHIFAGIDLAAPWHMVYWMGAWDADTLTGFVRGELRLTLR